MKNLGPLDKALVRDGPSISSIANESSLVNATVSSIFNLTSNLTAES